METGTKDGDTVRFEFSESVITCQICMEIFESPRILPCQHTFCKKCVICLLQRHCLDGNGKLKKTTFPCPNCRRECKIRKKGKQNMEDYLKCFPESLLLKTFLDSKEENHEKQSSKSSSAPDTEKELLEPVIDTYPGSEYGDGEHITSRAATVIQERLWLYCLFICKVHQFLRIVQAYYSSSLNKVPRSVFVILLKKLIEIPKIINNPVLYQYHVLEYFEEYDIYTSLHITDMLEKNIRTVIGDLEQNETHMGCVFKDKQTQTEEISVIIRTYKYIISQLQRIICFLLKQNMSVVKCVLEYLMADPNICEIDCSLIYTIPYRKVRCWLLLIKLSDIVILMHSAGQSFSWSFLFLMISYVLLLAFFKRIKKYIDGGICIGNTLPLFPLFLISLNLVINLYRCYIYYSAVIQLNFWFLARLFFFELVPELAVFITIFTLELCGKEHLIHQYGPFINFNPTTRL
ncbi:uncharacterized protein LOC123561872 [Mercenaria mercenaria]|uniref:uncharacterized protein LOC123561872 n=1 Tax=Mercenaria mercenaria TaxID=6596 RepID=UPI00234E663B|nr:uncharacterized protein LOC123561872 [Mercenaria mercenaria]